MYADHSRLLPIRAALAALLALGPATATTAAPAAAQVAPSPSPSPSPRHSLTLGSGQNSTQSGEFTVHYNAMPSIAITPEIARRHGITRSANRALLNVAVMRGPRAAESVPVTARIEAAGTNPNGQRQAVRLREVRDRGAIYYLGEARIEERDALVFELAVTPEGGSAIHVRFRQEFWPATATR